MKIYLAGPMQGYPEFNFPTFHKAAAYLRLQGHFVFSPAERDIERHGMDISKGAMKGELAEIAHTGFSLGQALADDTNFICLEADAIALLPGWEQSGGALAEWSLAKTLKRKFIYLREEDYTFHSYDAVYNP